MVSQFAIISNGKRNDLNQQFKVKNFFRIDVKTKKVLVLFEEIFDYESKNSKLKLTIHSTS